MPPVSFLPSDLSVLDVEAVLAAAEAIDTSVWPAGAAGVLAREDWRTLATGEILDLGRLIVELMSRGISEERWAPGPRDRAIALVEKLRAALPEASGFFARDEAAAGLRRLKARVLSQKRNERLRKERESKSLQTIEIDVHPDDAAELRKIADEMLRKRDIKPIERRKPGRPPKSSLTASPPAREPAPAKRLTFEEAFSMYFPDVPQKIKGPS